MTRGVIWFQGKDLPDLPERELRRICGAEIGMIFQDAGASLCPVRTIGAQMAESMAVHRKITGAQAKEKALSLFETLQLKDGARIWESYPFELSGGMQQRVGIAIAMCMNPPVPLRSGCLRAKTGGGGAAPPAPAVWHRRDPGHARRRRRVRHGGYDSCAERGKRDGIWSCTADSAGAAEQLYARAPRGCAAASEGMTG